MEPWGSGHINDTYAATYRDAGGFKRYVLQRINTTVFTNPTAQMENIQRVTQHVRGRLFEEGRDVERETLTLAPAASGRSFLLDPEGNYWRVYHLIEHSRTYDVVETPEQAHQASRAFGRFIALLSDFSGPRLHEVIPGFHDTPRRVAALEQAVEEDVQGRVVDCRREVDFVLDRKDEATRLIDRQALGEIPERIVHNDTKLSNVMMDVETNEAVCVVDLDTVMPGLSLYDFGDMIRSGVSPAEEDERDLSLIEIRLPIFEALVRGFYDSLGDVLTAGEVEELAFAGKLITYENGTRFLTDFLQGDIYFKTHRRYHNLDRCRTQFKLVALMEEEKDVLENIVAKIFTP